MGERSDAGVGMNSSMSNTTSSVFCPVVLKSQNAGRNRAKGDRYRRRSRGHKSRPVFHEPRPHITSRSGTALHGWLQWKQTLPFGWKASAPNVGKWDDDFDRPSRQDSTGNRGLCREPERTQGC